MHDDLPRHSLGSDPARSDPAARSSGDAPGDTSHEGGPDAGSAPDSDAGDGSAPTDDPADGGRADAQRATGAEPSEEEDGSTQIWRKRAEKLESGGLMHLEHGEYEEAGDLLAKALSLYEEHDDEERTLSVAQYLGVALYELGRADDAVAIWEEMMSRGWSGPTIFGLLLRHYEQQERPDKIERLHARLRHSVAATENLEYAPVETPPRDRPSRETPRVLVADNDDEVRNILVRILRMDGYDVVEATNGEEALRKVLEDPPDVVVLDVYMPKRSGLDVLYQLRARGLTTRALVISGIADDSMVRDAVVLGARFLGKPLHMDDLRETLETILGDHASERPEPGPA